MKLRRSMLFIPGNNPSMAKDVVVYQPDSIMFDLEDAIAIQEKDAARMLTYHALKTIDYHAYGIETVVRINSFESGYGQLDLAAIVPACPDIIRLPKTETAEDLVQVEAAIEQLEQYHQLPVGKIKLIAAVESAKGVMNATSIANASNRLVAIAIGGEDYVTNLKTKRSATGQELLFARCMILNAARAAGIAALDTVYSDVHNTEGFIQEAEQIHQLGFDGKSLIHPNQIELIHRIYTPSKQDIEKSLRIVEAATIAEANGQGVITVDGKMIDAPIIARAHYYLALARQAGVLKEETV